MVTRLEKEQKAVEEINCYAAKIGHPKVFSVKEIGDYIDTLKKKKGRQMYDTHKQRTANSSEVVDVEAASAAWENFQVYHRVFAGHPTWGVGQCRDTANLAESVASPFPSTLTTDTSVTLARCEANSETQSEMAGAETSAVAATATGAEVELPTKRRRTSKDEADDSSEDERRPKKPSRAD